MQYVRYATSEVLLYKFVMKTNFKVATARDCQESRGKRVDFIVVLLTSFRISYSFLFVQTLLLHCTRVKQKRTIFRDGGSTNYCQNSNFGPFVRKSTTRHLALFRDQLTADFHYLASLSFSNLDYSSSLLIAFEFNCILQQYFLMHSTYYGTFQIRPCGLIC